MTDQFCTVPRNPEQTSRGFSLFMADERKWVTEKFGKGWLAKNCLGEIAWLASYESSTPDPRGVESTRLPEFARGLNLAGRTARLTAEEIGWAVEQMRAAGLESNAWLVGCRGVYRASLGLHGRGARPRTSLKDPQART